MHAEHLIAGHWESGEDSRTVLDPGLGTSVGEVVWGGRDVAVLAVDSAARAFEDWSRTTPRKRADILRDVTELLAERSGAYVAPALVADLPTDSALVATEVFGPAAGILRFRTDDEALTLANSTEMGLAAYLWTRSPSRAWTFGEELETGIVGINDPVPSVAFAPMGGVKQSGLGREGTSVGLEEFLDTRYLAWRP